MAQDLIARIRAVTDKPIRHLVLSHYHAVRVLGASAFLAQGCEQIIASRGTYDLIVERGEQDMQSEIERFPRLFAGVETIPGLTWPTLVFEQALTLWLGGLEVRIAHLGAGHTKGDTVVWLPSQKVLFSGIWSSTKRLATAATLTWLSGRRRWKPCGPSGRRGSCLVEVPLCFPRGKLTMPSGTPTSSSPRCSRQAAKHVPKTST